MSRKIYLTLESIRAEYFDKGVSLSVAAKSLGCSVTVLRSCISNYGLKPKEKTWNREAFMAARFTQPTKLIPKDVIENVYLNKPVNMQTAITELGTSEDTFVRSMRAWGLQPKSKQWNKERRKSRFPLLNDKNALGVELETKSFARIARELGSTPGAVIYAARKHGLYDPTIGVSERIKEGLSKALPFGRFGKNAGNWQGGVRHLTKGYRGIYSPTHPGSSKEGYVMEHRLVMEEHLGRLLTKEEIIHHVNGRKDDNRIENLELVADQGTHTREHFERSHVTDLERIETARLRQLLIDNGINPDV